MSLLNIFDVAGRGMSAQAVRLNVSTSNLANAGNVAGSADEAYKPRHVLFETFQDALGAAPSVRTAGVVESQTPPNRRFEPNHPLADETGHVYETPVNTVEEMVDMMAASRAYQNNVEALDTAKNLLMRTLAIGQ